MKRRAFLTLIAALPATALTGCGFQLRGKNAIPYRSIYLHFIHNEPDTSYKGGLSATRPESVEPQLERALRDRGITIADNAKTAEVTLRVTQEKQTRTILSLSGGGRVREYRLSYLLTYTLIGADGQEIFPPSDIQQSRDFTYDDNQYLAKTAEENFLYRDLRDDAVQQIVRRLSKTK
jgi:LPS-assembly lipoprotein